MIKNKKLMTGSFTIAAFLCLLLMIVLAPNDKENIKIIPSGEEIDLIVASDLHYLSENLTDHGPAYQKYSANSDGRLMDYIEPLIDAFCYDMKKQSPDILILSGDLTNNGEKVSHEELAQKLRDIENSSGSRIYVIPGNHDILNPWARGFEEDKQYVTESVDAKEFAKIYKDFGYEEAISKDKGSLSYLAAPSEDLWLLMLDSNEYRLNKERGVPTTKGELRKGPLNWIKKCSMLARKKGAKLITVMHHNLIDHSRITSGFTLDNSQEAVRVFPESNIPLVLSGHLHIQDIRHTSEEDHKIYDIATGALIIYPQRYAKLTYHADQSLDYIASNVDVDNWARSNKIEDENLRNFTEYARKNFYNKAYEMAYERLIKLDVYTEEECDEMAKTVALMNINYFSGTIQAVKEEVMESKGYQLWLAAEETETMKGYVLSMLSNKNIDNTKLNLTLK